MIITDLEFCDEMQYAVPGNRTLFPDAESLRKHYDNYTQSLYNNFEKSLQQIQCEAPMENQYSLVRNCDDCRKAYKNWLCSVAIPRCEDFSETDRNYLHIRNINEPFPNGTLVDQKLRDEHGLDIAYNQSRNDMINNEIKPGPYKELLPCDYTCYELVQSCPAALGFACPLPGGIQFDVAYGHQLPGEKLSCNYPGSAHYPGVSSRSTISWATLFGLVGSVLAWTI
jgi:calcium channel MID1